MQATGKAKGKNTQYIGHNVSRCRDENVKNVKAENIKEAVKVEVSGGGRES